MKREQEQQHRFKVFRHNMFTVKLSPGSTTSKQSSSIIQFKTHCNTAHKAVAAML
jgi:hypothetical protein